MERTLWKCPQCGKEYRIPAGHNPELCVECQADPAIDSAELGLASVTSKRRRKSTVPTWAYALIVLLSCSILGAGWLWFKQNPEVVNDAVGTVIDIAEVDPDKPLVEKWLNENLDDPEWQEVRWWPAQILEEEYNEDLILFKEQLEFEIKMHEKYKKELESIKESKIGAAGKLGLYADLKKLIEENTPADTAAIIGRLEEMEPYRVCRLKFRSRNSANAFVLEDILFIIREGAAVPVPEFLPNAYNAKHRFAK